MKNLYKIIACAGLSLGLVGCDVEVTDKGELPDVDVQGDPGKLPDYDIVKKEEGRAPDLDVEVKDKGELPEIDVDVPDVDVKMKEVDVKVPKIVMEEKRVKVPVVETSPDEDNVDANTDTNTDTADTETANTNTNTDTANTETEAEGGQTIAKKATETPNLSTLVEALKAADLVETLNGEGPFTVFAPTNDAFNALPEGTVDSLLVPENKEKLKRILLYHVVASKAMASDVTKAIEDNNGVYEVETVAGNTLRLKLNDGKVVVTDDKGGEATVTTADVEQSNGVVHIIDSVLMPETTEVTSSN